MALGTYAGSAWIGVKPNFSGFNRATVQGATAGGKAGGKAMGKAFGDEAAASAKVSTRKLSADLGRARDSEATAAGRVRVAEARLAEARTSGRAKASQLASAEESLAKAQRDLTKAQDRTKGATERLTAAKDRNAAASVDAERKQSRFSKGLSTLRGRASNAASSLKNVAKQYGALAGAAVTAGAIKFGSSSISAASEAEQSLGATEKVFKKQADVVVGYSDQAATKYGLSANKYRESANLIGSLFKNQGVAADKLAGKTDAMIGKASDLAATFGGDTKTAVESLSSAYKGEFDPLERYGISLKQSTVNTEAWRLAGVKSKKEWDGLTLAQQRTATQTATTNLIMRQSKDSMGAFGDEAGTLAGQQQRLSAMWEDGKVVLGKALIPTLTTGLSKVTSFVSEMRSGEGAGGRFADRLRMIGSAAATGVRWVQDHASAIKTFAYAVGVTVIAVKGYTIATRLAELWTKRQAIAQGLLNTVMRLNPVGLVVTALIALGAGLVLAYKKSETFRRIVDRAFSWVKRAGSAMVGWFRSTAWPVMTKVFSWIGQKATWLWAKAIRPALSGIGSGARKVFGWFRTTGLPVVRGALQKIGSVVSWLWNRVYKPYLGFIWGIAKKVFGWIKNTGAPWVGRAFSVIGSGARTLWTRWLKPNFERIRAGANLIKTTFTRVKEGIGKAWSGLSSAISGPVREALNWIDRNFLSKVRGMLRTIGLGDLAKKIPSLVISTGKSSNGSRQMVSGGTPPRAAGGPIPGPWRGPKADNVLGISDAGVPTARVNPREYIQPVSRVQQYGLAGMEAVRRGTARIVDHNGRIYGGRLPGLAGGGMVYQRMASWLKSAAPSAIITSTTGGGHSARSYHYQGKALDIGGPLSLLQATAEKIKKAFGSSITELILNPGASIKNGKSVPPSFWGAQTWANHGGSNLHLHWAMNALTKGGALTGGTGLLSGLAAKVYEKGSKALTGILDKIPGGFWSKVATGPLRLMTKNLVERVKTYGDSLATSTVDGGYQKYTGSAKNNLSIGWQMAKNYGWTGSEWSALRALWQGESNWNHLARNPSSGAYGIPQALPGSKMAAAGPDWRTNPATQISWGLKYIKDRPDYGRPSKALALWRSRSPHWYASGTHHAESGPAWIGEAGPELVWLRGGERVTNHRDSVRMLTTGTGPQQISGYLTITEDSRAFFEATSARVYEDLTEGALALGRTH